MDQDLLELYAGASLQDRLLAQEIQRMRDVMKQASFCLKGHTTNKDVDKAYKLLSPEFNHEENNQGGTVPAGGC